MTVTRTFGGRRPGMPPAARAAAAAGVCAGAAAGVAVAVDPRLGAMLALAALAIPVALIDLPVAAAGWAGLGPVSDLPAFGLATTAAAILVAAAWFARLTADRARVAAALRVQRRLLTAVGLLLVWLALSLGWAQDPGAAGAELARWCAGAAALAILVTSVRTPRDAVVIVAALVTGTLVSVLIGLVGGSLGSAATTVETATSTEGRLQGGAGDPNVLAAYIVPAVVLAAALRPLLSGLARSLVAPAVVLLALGLGATQSRGGLLAAAAALVAALALMRGRRMAVAATAVGVACVAIAYFAAAPGAFERLTSAAADRGNGREDLWLVAERMSAENPVAGVGLGNFRVRSGDYVRRPGTLQFVDLVAERPHEVHDTYLQMLAEAGVVGLALFAAFVGAALASARRAALRFEAAGEAALARLARAVLVADVGLLTAAVFLSIGSRPTFWVLLSLGPVLLGMASTTADAPLRPHRPNLPDRG